MRKTTAIIVTAACGVVCGTLLAFPWAAHFSAVAPLTLFPVFYAYRYGNRAASVGFSALYAAAALLVGLAWIYTGAAAHQGPGDYYTSLLGLIFECIPYALVGFAASYARTLPSIPWSVTVASLWTLGEYVRSTSPLGVPYAQMGHALIDTPLVWLARVGGTETLTFLCVFVAAALFEVTRRPSRLRAVAWALLAILIAGNAMTPNAAHADTGDGPTVAVLQLGLVDDANLGRYLAASRTLPATMGLAVWPESALDLSRNDIMNALQATARARHAPLLVGGSMIDVTGIHDALDFIGGNGIVQGYYAKRRLVPFGEYLPLPQLARILIPTSLVSGMYELSAGHEPVTFDIGGRTIGPLICYESAFPALARDEVRRGANLLVAATNDVWFTQASGLWELEQTARLVAIETGTPLVLSGTVGPSGVIDANGRWTGSLPVDDAARAVFHTPAAHPTPYDTVGDWPWIAAMALSALALLALARRGGSV